jgi:hypothetical protein
MEVTEAQEFIEALGSLIESLKYTRVINKSTRNRTDIEEIAVGIENFV